MKTLQGKYIGLRALEPEDLEFLYQIENDESIWELSNTQTPYSKFLLEQYLENAHKDIFEAKQLRLVITSLEHKTFGLVDIFDFDPKNKRAGIGILISNPEDRDKGYGSEALSLVIKYCFKHLFLHQLYANIDEHNVKSLKLFETQGFKKIGLKEDWNFNGISFSNEYILQLITN
ncbi:GNAT family N-acetyltransferase [Ichthyenterobacterium sp. W332]|uniref:GNAT family N-acetyltransferase n=1 Tax=Microcosmobacter mediterraneus TaxID=3075607 RepID=A0ABU2YH66_9FLAO|nr:GNAT family N-acetyltransferase [Ichthyenterobacterium sp. W332]MDT0557512.1 GNAT family N-acetyltransferase [Ichthyenterobacterium sp. W332]